MKKFILIILLIFSTHLHVEAMELTPKLVYVHNKDCRGQDSNRKQYKGSNENSLIKSQQSSQLKICFETINSYEKFLLKPENIWHTEFLLNNMLYIVSRSLDSLMNVQENAVLLDFTKNMLEKNGYLAFASIKNNFDSIMNSQLIPKFETNEHEVNPGCNQSPGYVDGLEHSSLIDFGCDSAAIEKQEHFFNAMHDDEQKRLQGIDKILMKIDSNYNLLSRGISSLNRKLVLEVMIDDMYELAHYLYQFNHYKHSSTKLIDKMVEDYKNDGYVCFPTVHQKLNNLIKLRNFYTRDDVANPIILSDFFADQSSQNLLTAQSNKEESLDSQLHTFIDNTPLHFNYVYRQDQQEMPLAKVVKTGHENLSLSKFGWQNESNSFCVCKRFRGKKYAGLISHCYDSHAKKINDEVYYDCPSDQCKTSPYKRRTFIVHLIEVHKLFNIEGTKLVKFISADNAFESITKVERENKIRSRAKSIAQVPIRSKKDKKIKKSVLHQNDMIVSDEKLVPIKDEISIDEPIRYIECDNHIENSNDFWECFDEFFKVEKDHQAASAI